MENVLLAVAPVSPRTGNHHPFKATSITTRLLLALILVGSTAFLTGCPAGAAGAFMTGLSDGMARGQVTGAYAQRQRAEAEYLQEHTKMERDYLELEKQRLDLARQTLGVQQATPPTQHAVKRYAELKHVKGPYVTVPPQVLRAEYIDTGEGYGPVHVTYPGNSVLTGEYLTIASGEKFKGQVTAKLIDPDKVFNFPNSSLRGFASFAGSDGTIMECVYAVAGPSGNGVGSCLDNRNNQYQLSF